MLSTSDPSKKDQWPIINKLFLAITQLNVLNTMAKEVKNPDTSNLITVHTKLEIAKIINLLLEVPYKDGLDCLDHVEIDNKSLMQWINVALIPLSKQFTKDCSIYTNDSFSSKILADVKADTQNPVAMKGDLLKAFAVPLSPELRTKVTEAAESKYDLKEMTNELLPLFNQIIHTIYEKKQEIMKGRLEGLEREEKKLTESINLIKERKSSATIDNDGMLSKFGSMIKTLNTTTIKSISDLMDVIKRKIPNPFTTVHADVVKKLKNLTTSFPKSMKFSERIGLIRTELSNHIKQVLTLIELLKKDEIVKKSTYDKKWIADLSTLVKKLEEELANLNLSMENKDDVKNAISERIKSGVDELKDNELKFNLELDSLVKFKDALTKEDKEMKAHPISKISSKKLSLSDLRIFYDVTTAMAEDRFDKELKEHQTALILASNLNSEDPHDVAIINLTSIVNFGSFLIYHTDPMVAESFPFMQRYAEGLKSIESLRTNSVVFQIIIDYLQENIIAALRHFCMHSVDSSARCDDLLSHTRLPELKQTTSYLNDVIEAYFADSDMNALPPGLATEAVIWNRAENKPASSDELLKIAADIVDKFKRDATAYLKARYNNSFFVHSPFDALNHLADLILSNKIQNSEQGKLMLKFDGLIQALGEVFNALASVDKANFVKLLDFAGPIMHYRNNKTHSGIAEKHVLLTSLEIMLSKNMMDLLKLPEVEQTAVVTYSRKTKVQ